MRKGFALTLFILIMLFINNIPAFAANEAGDMISHSRVSTHQTRDSMIAQINPEQAVSDDYLIQEWYCEIREMNNDQVELYGWTQCIRDCDAVSVELRLQCWNGSSWTTIGAYEFEDFDTDYSWGIRTISVSAGNYYRVKSYHHAEDGSILDQTTAVTEAIYIP